MNKIKIFSIICIVITIISIIHIFSLKKQNQELKDKINFYEKVMYEFNVDEYIDYPELYYEDGYNDQVKIHNCIWAVDLQPFYE